jgi:PKHD-type hydroxylase
MSDLQLPWWGRGIQLLRRFDPGERDASMPFLLDTTDGPMPCNPSAIGVSVHRRALSAAECRRAADAARAEPSERGRMVGAAAGTRACHCAWIPDRREHAWLYDRVAALFEEANEQFRFRLTGMVEPVMAVAYGEGDRFDWHLDAGPELPANRKLSLSLLLTGPEAYEGGALEIAGTEEKALRPDAGSAIVFPSFLAHRVTTVTRGRRIALVAFAYGPTFC